MKSFNLTVLFLAITCLVVSCKKGGDDEGENCEDNNTTKVTYSNTGSVPLRVVVATSLTSQYEPINPILNIDLAPGASTVKEFDADQYFNVWYSNCSDDCSMVTYYSKTYAQCSEYEEKQGF
ncbi:MAG: hypothetical protein JNK79_13045 [Chitinophagaceae bacterium]|nr:hypothetical protein [Chitinophagaceae bacterium]